MLNDVHERFDLALSSPDPTFALDELAQLLKSEGMTQIEMYKLFSHYQQATEADDSKYDAIVDTMYSIWGGSWAKGRALFDQELKESDLS